MTFGGGLVVAPALRKREAVVNAGVQLNLALAAGGGEQSPQLLHHRQRRELIVFGAGDVQLALHLA